MEFNPAYPMILSTVILVSCGNWEMKTEVTQPDDEIAVRPTVFDAGDVSIDNGPRRLTHTFEVVNDGHKHATLDVRSSCGCLEAKLHHHDLGPGESTLLEIAIRLDHAGRTTETASVLFSHGEVMQFVISANVVMQRVFNIFLREPRIGPSMRTEVRAYLIDSHGHGDPVAPTVLAPEAVEIVESTWVTIEEDHSEQRRRPTRQVGTLTLDFTNYAGPYPVEVVFQSSSGIALPVTFVTGK